MIQIREILHMSAPTGHRRARLPKPHEPRGNAPTPAPMGNSHWGRGACPHGKLPPLISYFMDR